MRTVRNSILARLILPLAVLVALSAVSSAGAQSGNLLQNPSFEEGFYTFNPDDFTWVALYSSQRADCRTSDGQDLPCNTAQTPNGWIPWWISHAEGDPDWKNRMPEYKPATHPFANRLHHGNFAAQYFTFHSTHTAGLLQVVDVPANAEVQFSIWGQAWSSTSDSDFSDFPTPVNMRIGIDPTGNTNPYDPNIVWSDYKQPYDSYQQFTVEAQAQGDTVTVFTISSPDEARKHNDIYWDNASLVATGQGEAPPPPTATAGSTDTGGETDNSGDADAGDAGDTGNTDNTSGETAPPAVAQGPAGAPTATPDAEGVIYYEAQDGDSYWSIAARHELTIDEIYELNNAGEGDFVQPGELIVIGHAEPPATPTAEGEEAAAEPTATSAPPTATPTPAPQTGEVCLVAYEDDNQNGQRDAGESLKGSVAFSIYDGQEVLVNYVTDGNSEPYCIELDNGNYRITRSSQPNETLTTDGEWAISVTAGSEQDFEFGSYTDGGDGVAALSSSDGEGADADGAGADSATADSAAMALPEENAAAEENSVDDEGDVTRWVVIAAVVVAVLLFVGVLVIILSGRRSTI